MRKRRLAAEEEGLPTEAAQGAPSLLLALLEAPRALTEASTLWPARAFLKSLGGGDGHTVLVLPGFLASDRSTLVLRDYCTEWGYDAQPWGLGRNIGLSVTRDLERRLDGRLAELFRTSGRKVSLIGWSLGGLYAREMARRQPKRVRQVITLGSPIGNPRSTRVWRLYEALSGTRIDDAVISQRIRRLRDPLANVPMTAIYSESDAIVSSHIARLPASDLVENVGIAASHLGMGFNPAVLYVIADRLRQPEGQWAPFRINGFRGLFFH